MGPKRTEMGSPTVCALGVQDLENKYKLVKE